MKKEDIDKLKWIDSSSESKYIGVDVTIEVYDNEIIVDKNKLRAMHGWLLNKEKLDSKESKLLSFIEECLTVK